MIIHNMVKIRRPMGLIRVTQKGLFRDQSLMLSTFVRLVRLELLFEGAADGKREAAVDR